MKEYMLKVICDFIAEYEKRDDVHTKWGKPVIGFADAYHPLIQKLPQIISESHGLPQDVMNDAKIVIAYYVPFTRELAKANKTGTIFAAPEWALAYEETNSMFVKLNSHIIEKLQECGYKGGIHPKTSTFNKEKLISDWSYRHFAYAAGLGTFGINNMLITPEGCCGRYNTVVTNLDVEPDSPVKEEYCLYKKNGSCGICIRNCPSHALTAEGFDRHKCYEILMKNAEIYTDFGSSYTNEDGKGANSCGSDVCGKCITQSPCAFWKIR